MIIELNEYMLQINPKRFKPIKNKTIPNPLRPKFRNKSQANIYFLSKRKFNLDKRIKIIKKIKFISFLSAVLISGYFLTS
jgi:hypothetical protein